MRSLACLLLLVALSPEARAWDTTGLPDAYREDFGSFEWDVSADTAPIEPAEPSPRDTTSAETLMSLEAQPPRHPQLRELLDEPALSPEVAGDESESYLWQTHKLADKPDEPAENRRRRKKRRDP